MTFHELPDALVPMVDEAAAEWLFADGSSSRDLAVRIVEVLRREGVSLRLPRPKRVRPPAPEPPPDPDPPSLLTSKPAALPADARRIAARMETP